MNLNETIIKIRCELQGMNLKKSGKNSFQGFDYYELSDFLPTLNKLMEKYGVNDRISIDNDLATLTLIKGDESQYYAIPFRIFETPTNEKKDYKTGEIKVVKSMQDIQYLGALNTYYKRYLYLNAFGITDGEIIDGMNNNELAPVQENVQETKQAETLKQETSARDELVKYCEENKLDMKDIAKEYKLNAKSTDGDFMNALSQLKAGK